MQQTKTYKLNKPGKTDVFTPDPFNENMDKVEAALSAETAARAAGDAALHAAVAGVDARNCLIKLAGPLVARAYGEELEVDLSGVDMGQFTVLMVVSRSAPYAAMVRFNRDVNLYAHVNTTNQHQGAIAVMLQSDEDRIMCYYQSIDGTRLHEGIREVVCPMADVRTMTFYGNYDAGSRFTLYGIKG